MTIFPIIYCQVHIAWLCGCLYKMFDVFIYSCEPFVSIWIEWWWELPLLIHWGLVMHMYINKPGYSISPSWLLALITCTNALKYYCFLLVCGDNLRDWHIKNKKKLPFRHLPFSARLYKVSIVRGHQCFVLFGNFCEYCWAERNSIYTLFYIVLWS